MNKKAILFRAAAVAGVCACLYGAVGGLSVYVAQREVGQRLQSWCAKRALCQSATVESSIDATTVHMHFRPTKQAIKPEGVLAELEQSGVLVARTLFGLTFKLPPVRVQLQ